MSLHAEEWEENYLLITHGNSTTVLDHATQGEFFEWYIKNYGATVVKVYSVIPLTEESFEQLVPIYVPRNQIIYGEGS